MTKYDLILRDINNLDEKLQGMRSEMSLEEYEKNSEKMTQIKNRAVNLTDKSTIGDINAIIEEIVELEYNTLSNNITKEMAKNKKRETFIKKLDYMIEYVKSGEDIKDLVDASESYWNSIKENYDEIENKTVKDKIDEIKFEMTISRISQTKKIELSNVLLNDNYFLIRDRMQELLNKQDVPEEDKILLESWLAEGLDIKTGTIDKDAMSEIIKSPKLWGILANVQEQHLSITDKEYVSKELRPLNTESEERKKEIEEICIKYNIDENKLRTLLSDTKEVIYISKFGPFYRLVTKEDYDKKRKPNKKNIKVAIYKNNLTSIGMLDGNYFIKSEQVVLPDSLKAIRPNAFEANYNLKYIRLPEGLKTISESAFLYSGIEKINIPDSVKKIESRAFDHSELEEINFGNGLEYIGADAFFFCRNMTNVEIPGSVKIIDYAAFGCTSLQTLVLHEGLEQIGENAFQDTKLTSILLPHTVKICKGIADSYTEVLKQNNDKNSNQFNKEENSLEKLREEKEELEITLKTLQEQIKELEQKIERETGRNEGNDRD